MSFDKAYSYTLKWEGGYSNDPHDHGKETYKGISRVWWPDWEGWKTIDRAKRNSGFEKTLLTNKELDDHVRAFYIKNFWGPIKGEDISSLSEDVAAEVFDAAVNMGVKRASKYFQKALNVFNRNGTKYADITVDGSIGPNTLKLYKLFMNNNSDDLMMKALLIQRGGFYMERAVDEPSQERFIRGWLNRLVVEKFNED